jgi:hypothetical protein
MIDDGDRKDKSRPRAAYSRATPHLICNVLDINQTQHGVQLGVFTSGASSKLVDRRDGLIYQPNAAPNAEELARQNYMWAYANGDMTDPTYAPVLVVENSAWPEGMAASHAAPLLATTSCRHYLGQPCGISFGCLLRPHNMEWFTGQFDRETAERIEQHTHLQHSICA